MASIAEVLYGAADLIEKVGLWKRGGGGSNPGGGTCAANAISYIGAGYPGKVLSLTDEDAEVSRRFRMAFADYLGGKWSSDIFAWNDDPERTQEQVVAALRAAAVIEESREAAAIIAAARELDVRVVGASS